MKYYSTSIHLRTSQEAAWEFLADLHRNPEWASNVQTVLFVSEGPVGKDTVFKERIRIFGPFHAEGEWHITLFDAPMTHEHRGNLPFTGATTIRYMLEPDEDGCLCTVLVYYSPKAGALGNVMNALFIRPGLSRTMRRNLRRLKRVIEAPLDP